MKTTKLFLCMLRAQGYLKYVCVGRPPCITAIPITGKRKYWVTEKNGRVNYLVHKENRRI